MLKLTTIKTVIECHAKVSIMDDSQHSIIVFARHVFTMIAIEEGYKHEPIADFLNRDISNVGKSLKRFDELIQTNKIVKNLYLKCVSTIDS